MLRHFLDDFLSFVPLQLPQLIDVTTMEETNDKGMVTFITATVYDSLEQMYGDLCLDLDVHSKGGTFKYKKEKEDILLDFM